MDALLVTVNAIGWTLIHSIWLGALAALVYALPAARLRNDTPQAAYAWGLACLFGLALLLGGVFLHELDRLLTSADERAIALARAALPVPGVFVPALAAPLPESAPVAGFAATIEPLLPLLVMLWALAVAIIGAGLVRSQLALRRLVAASLPLPDLAAAVRELTHYFGITRPVAVVSSTLARAPFVIGYWAPVIVLPLSVAAGMPVPQLRLILAHEIAHLRRADYLVNWLQLALEVLLFFHPAVRWLSEELRRLREACCDDLVVAYAGGGRSDYTRALLSLAEHRNDAPLLAPSAVAGGLLWRVQRIAGRAPRERGGLQRIVLPALLFGFLLSLLAGGVHVRPGAGPREFAWPRADVGATPAQAQAELGSLDWQAQLPPLADALGSPEIPSPARRTPAPAGGTAGERLPLPVVRSTPIASPAPEAPGVPVAARFEAPAVATAPTLLHSKLPRYPGRVVNGARIVEVELSYAVDTNGAVGDIRTESAPADAQAFIDSARLALAEWRYTPGGSERLRHRFVFRDQTEEPTPGCKMVPGTRVCVVDGSAPRSQISPDRSQVSPMSGRRCDVRTGTRLCRR